MNRTKRKQRRRREKRREKKRMRLVESASTLTRRTFAEATPEGAIETLPEGGGARRKITVIKAGWGSSGFYPREVLERDGPKTWPKGTHMYLNHPSTSEESDRPERDLRDLVGVVGSDPVMEGDALVAEAEVFEHWSSVINSLAPHIGVSIRAMGEMEHGEAGGKQGPIIRSLDEGISVDFVTRAGAGGEVGELIESARAQNFDPPESGTEDGTVTQHVVPVTEKSANEAEETSKEDVMSDAERTQLAELQESVESLRKEHELLQGQRDEALAEKERAEEALLRIRAERVVAEASTTPDGSTEPVSVFKGLSARAVTRVKEAVLSSDVPTTEDGKLDEQALIETTVKAASEERDYLREAGLDSSPKVEGMGAAEKSSEGDVDLEGSFRRLGLTETAAKSAAEGR